jgi:hypothetical protein
MAAGIRGSKNEKINFKTFASLQRFFNSEPARNGTKKNYTTYFVKKEYAPFLNSFVHALKIHHSLFSTQFSTPDIEEFLLVVHNVHIRANGYLYKTLTIYPYRHKDNRACKGLSSVLPAGCLIEIAKSLKDCTNGLKSNGMEA